MVLAWRFGLRRWWTSSASPRSSPSPAPSFLVRSFPKLNVVFKIMAYVILPCMVYFSPFPRGAVSLSFSQENLIYEKDWSKTFLNKPGPKLNVRWNRNFSTSAGVTLLSYSQRYMCDMPSCLISLEKENLDVLDPRLRTVSCMLVDSLTKIHFQAACCWAGRPELAKPFWPR